jgi:hypothetical protein
MEDMQVRDTLHAVRGGDRDLFPAVSNSAQACLEHQHTGAQITASGAQNYCNVRPELLRRALKSTATDAQNYGIPALRTTV